MAALNANNVPTAIDFAERAVAKTPNDAGFRALLGNAYFAGGRFRSAEAAYKDSLTIDANQPQVVLKLALVQIAQGKNGEAVAFLECRPRDPRCVRLRTCAGACRPSRRGRSPCSNRLPGSQGADATVRQNLALAYALAGDWTEARD